MLFFCNGSLLCQVHRNQPVKHDREGSDREAAKVPMRHDLDLRINGWGLAIAIASRTCQQQH